MDDDGNLDLQEFMVAMHLVGEVQETGELPSTMQAYEIPPSKMIIDSSAASSSSPKLVAAALVGSIKIRELFVN